jgi:Haem-NO-binding
VAGGYEAACRYDLAELVHLVDQLATARGEPRAAVLSSFGRHLFRYFAALYPTFLDEAGSALGLLAGIDAYVHGELRKLYPDADFPRFECAPAAPDGLAMSYRSTRPLADLAEGLILGCIEHFGDQVRVAREDLPGAPGTAARFVVTPERG